MTFAPTLPELKAATQWAARDNGPLARAALSSLTRAKDRAAATSARLSMWEAMGADRAAGLARRELDKDRAAEAAKGRALVALAAEYEAARVRAAFRRGAR